MNLGKTVKTAINKIKNLFLVRDVEATTKSHDFTMALSEPSHNIIFNYKKKEEGKMTVNKFAQKVSRQEKGKKQVNIAQIMEILKVTNKLIGGELYKIIRRM